MGLRYKKQVQILIRLIKKNDLMENLNQFNQIIQGIKSDSIDFQKKINRISSEWKDARKKEFYNKYVNNHISMLTQLTNDLESIRHLLENSLHKLKH